VTGACSAGFNAQLIIKGEQEMLGEKIGSESGKVTSQRVLPNHGGGPKMETTFHSTGTMLGVSHSVTATYWSVVRGDGTLYGEGQGVVMGKGGEMATWVGQGVGTFKKDGSVSYRGAIYYQSASSAWMRLNHVASPFEFEVDAQGNCRGEIWEWK
jgi:hypothetical protein